MATIAYGRARYWGSTSFEDICVPTQGKSEYGIDTVTRKMKGAAYLVTQFLASLQQGQAFNFRSVSATDITQVFGGGGTGIVYLQTWQSDDDPVYPTVSLNYKGLLAGSPPKPQGTSELTLQSCTVSCASPTNASRDITYYSPQTSWKYISNGRVTTQQNQEVTGNSPEIFSSVIRNADGTVYFGNAPVGLVTALTPAVVFGKLMNLQCTPVWGTPFYEVDEVVATVFQTA